MTHRKLDQYIIDTLLEFVTEANKSFENFEAEIAVLKRKIVQLETQLAEKESNAGAH